MASLRTAGQRSEDRRCPAGHVEFTVNVFEVLGDRARANVERVSDGTVSTPERGETQDPHLPVGEVGETGDRTGGRCRQAFPGALALAGAI
jgi:hypothetical protein